MEFAVLTAARDISQKIITIYYAAISSGRNTDLRIFFDVYDLKKPAQFGAFLGQSQRR
jgi:hypothetical protein